MSETIAAIATAPGRGGVGVVRISGPQVPEIAHQMLGGLPAPRQAILKTFYAENSPIDKGLVLYFPAPHSFTGEAVLELHGHGGPVVMDLLLSAVLATGARMAFPGEFSQRAFLNGKMDLAQAEAVADLIEAATKEAVHSANRSLQGAFSQKIKDIVDAVMHLRLMMEAAIDFSEEDIDWMGEQKILEHIEIIHKKLHTLFTQAKQGALLKEGITLAIVGRPNVGKSSLFNALTQNETAIVTPLPGTTRDLIKESIHIEGYPVHLVDTAGFRERAEPIEQEGIKRAQAQLALVDQILWVVESPEETFPELSAFESKVTRIINKIDLLGISPKREEGTLYVSAKENKGIDLLRTHIKACMGCQGEESGGFIARKRHLIALEKTRKHLDSAKENLVDKKAFDCAAEELRLAQNSLGEIVGKVTTEDVLGEIFSRFCIGK